MHFTDEGSGNASDRRFHHHILEGERASDLTPDAILEGGKSGNLSMGLPRPFDLVINLKTAEALGLNIPQSVLIPADEVIQ